MEDLEQSIPKQEQPSFSKKKIFVFSFVIFVFSIVFALISAEVFFRFTKEPIEKIISLHTYFQLNIEYGIEPKPNLNYLEYDIPRKTNSAGMYSPEISKEKSGLRIAFLGDSYTVGPGIAREDNYPHLVTKAYKEKFPNADYLVGGVGGSSPLQQKYILEKKILEYQPDIIIYELYENDLGDDFAFMYSDHYARMQSWAMIPDYLKKSSLAQQISLAISNRMAKRNSEYYTSIVESKTTDKEKIWREITAPSMDRILEIARENNIDFYLMQIPTGTELGYEYKSEPSKPRSPLATAAKNWAEKNSVSYVDIFESLEKENTEELFEVFLPGEKGYHLTEKGAQIATDAVVDMILKTGE